MNTKICRVCGGQATEFNYDGLSCESCKVFFCRNSAKIEFLKCEFDGNCAISIDTRKKCPKCRLIKCLSIGMIRKNNSNLNKNENILSKENQIKKGIEPLLEISILKFLSNFDLKNVTKYVSNQMDVQFQRKLPLSLELNQFELERIAVAQNAIGFVFRDERAAPIVKHVESYEDYFDTPSLLYIKKSINFCQHFAAFNSLNNGDQLALLKPFSLDLMGIWFNYQSDINSEGILMFSDESESETIFVPFEITLRGFKEKAILKAITESAYALHDALEGDATIRDLLCATFLFKHTENLSSPENIRYHHHLYSMLLLRYLQQKYHSRKVGNRKYLKLIRLLDQLKDFTKHKHDFVIEFGVDKYPHIVLELYDLV